MSIPATSPSTNVTFYKGVKLSKDYQHVFYYGSQSQQDGYFSSLQSMTYNSILYQNFTDNTLRIGKPIKDLDGYNYFTFINNSINFERKKFYCFIDSITSINNNTTEIRYTVDVFNTFAFDYATNRCYILRQHAANDNLYKHLEPENTIGGEYSVNQEWLYYDDDGKQLNMSNMGAILIVNEDYTNGYSASPVRNYDAGVSGEQVYAGAIIVAANSQSMGISVAGLPLALHTIIQQGHSESILGCYLCPDWIINALGPTSSGTYEGWVSKIYATRSLKFTPSSTVLNGYTPRNKKLYTYPYRYFCVYNNDGVGEVLKYELNNGSTINLNQYGVAVGKDGVSVITVPYQYNGFVQDWTHNISWTYNEQLLLNRDNLAEWWRSNATAVAIGAMSSIFSAVAAGISAPTALQATAGSATIANNTATGIATQVARAESAPTTSFGNCNTTPSRSSSHLGVFCADMCYRKQDLEQIDAYFDRYGYAVNKIETPSQYNREIYTYIQTSGSNITSLGTNYLTNDFISQINAAFDRGITFWYAGASNAYSNIGNFTSSVVSGNLPLEV